MTLHGYQALLPRTVGFDRLLSTLNEFDALIGEGKPPKTYPPYNLVKYADDRYKIELAVAGFSRDELDVSIEGNKLTITGSATESPEVFAEREYVHKGIGKRSFTHVFTLAETIVVKGADVVDGLLVIELCNVIPDEKKPRKIEIGQFDKDNKQFLVEE
jgi:molecular chaperone IbpA